MAQQEVLNSPMTGSMKSSPGATQSSARPGSRRRSLEQNRLMWELLSDISESLQWPVDGELQWLTKEDWKVLLTAGLKREHRIAKGIWGGFVLLGTPTSRMTVEEMTELIELIIAFGTERGVIWSHDLP